MTDDCERNPIWKFRDRETRWTDEEKVNDKIDHKLLLRWETKYPWMDDNEKKNEKYKRKIIFETRIIENFCLDKMVY